MDKLNAIVEIISFEKLIAGAKKRNEVFFQKLGVDGMVGGEAQKHDEDAA